MRNRVKEEKAAAVSFFGIDEGMAHEEEGRGRRNRCFNPISP